MPIQLMIALAAGLAFSLIAVAYRSNAARSVPPCFVGAGMGLAGALWFGFRSFAGAAAPGPEAPALVWGWGVANGAAQGIVVWLYREGMRRGPLGPVWCAGNLTFVTPAIVSVGLLGERLSGLQMAGMAAAFLCVTVSSLGHGEEPGEGGVRRATAGQRLVYGSILLGLVLLTGLVGVALKHMAAVARDGAPLNPRFNDCFMLGMYGVLLAVTGTEVWRHGFPKTGAGRVGWNGLMASTGSVLGMVLTARISGLPGGVGFAVIAVASVLGGALITAFVFRDRRGPAWYATLLLAVASVVLFNLAGGAAP